jgi:hypothetical protein
VNQPIIKNSYLIEVNITTPAVGQRYYFLDVPTLRAPYVFINGVEAYTADQVTFSPLNAPIITQSGSTGVTITFAVKESEDIYQMPYFSYVAGYNSGIIRELANKQINLTKSYITILDTTNIVAGQSALFNVYYQVAR